VFAHPVDEALQTGPKRVVVLDLPEAGVK
jgi:hypothetical protein